MIRLNNLFSDGAVLQREQMIPVWGVTLPGTVVKAEIAGASAFSRSDKLGRFTVLLPALPAGGPYELSVSTPSTGECITVQDVLIGEVWLCSGQSNMEYLLTSEWAPLKPGESREEAQKVSRQQCEDLLKSLPERNCCRYFSVALTVTGMKEEQPEGLWHELDKDFAPGASAVGSWFQYYLQKELKVPVGVILSARGGSRAEPWISEAGFMSSPELRHICLRKKRIFATEDVSSVTDSDELFMKNCPFDRENNGEKSGWQKPGFDDASWEDFEVPGSWVQRGKAGNGAVWLRKEITIPASWEGKELEISTGGIDKHDVTYFNGEVVGRTGTGHEVMYWGRPRRYRVPGRLVKAGKAVIAIRVFSFISDGSLNGHPSFFTVRPAYMHGEKAIPIDGTWKFKVEYDLGKVVCKAVPTWEWGRGVCCHDTPSILFDGMIYPLRRYGIRGALWYQGESNASSKSVRATRIYSKLMKALVSSWRYEWEQGDFPFIQVELANYGTPDFYTEAPGWAVLREEQKKVCQELPGVYRATAVDLGDNDPDALPDIHPQNKREIGRRLALAALDSVYHTGTCGYGPEYESASNEGNSIRVRFLHGQGLTLKQENIASFRLAGFDRVFYPAETCRVEGSSIVLSSSKVPEPLFVRYAWSGSPLTALYNDAGLPAFPFRTDLCEIL